MKGLSQNTENTWQEQYGVVEGGAGEVGGNKLTGALHPIIRTFIHRW